MRIRSILSLFAVATLFAACSSVGEKTVQTEEYICSRLFPLPAERAPQFDCDSLQVCVDIELPVGSNWEAARECILSRIIPEKPSSERDTMAIPFKVNALRSDYVAEYREFIAAFPDEYRPFSYCYLYDGLFVDPWGQCVTYKLICSTYTGGAHGMTTETYMTFDTKTGRQMFLEDMLPEIDKESIRLAALSRLKDVEGFDESFIMYDPSVVYTENVYYGEDGVTFVYQPYDVACYAVGIVEVLVPWHDFEEIRSSQEMI